MANPALTAVLALLAGPSLLQGISNSFPPYGPGLAKKGFDDRPNLLPTPADSIGLRLKNLISDATYTSFMRESGYSPDIAAKLLSNARGYLSVFDYVSLWRRGEISKAQLDEKLGELGFDGNGVALAVASTEYIPTPQDLIRFAVRDVYTPATAEQYGLFEDFPTDSVSRAAQVGLSLDTLKEYWAAHWELPSPTQVYDMLHRGILTEEQVATYLKAADYMPYWRDKLIKLSYDNYTRVDVRRMYALGILNESQVKRAYMDLGYDNEKAENLTRFTVLDSQHSDESTPSSSIVAAYKAGSLDRVQAIGELMQSGVDATQAERLIDAADIALKQELIDLEADSIIDSYQRGGITLDEVRAQLTRIGVSSRMMELTIARELAQWRKRQKIASKADLDTWWRFGIVGSIIYSSAMKGLGYNEKDITNYLSELNLGDLIGKDKAMPFGNTLRDFSDGLINDRTALVRLGELGYDDTMALTLLKSVQLAQS